MSLGASATGELAIAAQSTVASSRKGPPPTRTIIAKPDAGQQPEAR